MSKEPLTSDFSDHERRVYRSQITDPPLPPVQETNQAGPAGNSNLEGVPPDFESQWQAYIAHSRHPGIYDTSHKACALLGYHWAVAAYKSLTKKIEPL